MKLDFLARLDAVYSILRTDFDIDYSSTDRHKVVQNATVRVIWTVVKFHENL